MENTHQRKSGWIGKGLGVSCALALVATLVVPAWSQDLDLPPPPVSAEPPTVDVAVLRAAASDPLPEEIFADAPSQPAAPVRDEAIRPASEALARPAPAMATPAGGASDLLETIRQEPTGAGGLESELFEQLRALMPEGSEGFVFERATLPSDAAALPLEGCKVKYDFRLPTRGVGLATYSASVTGPDGKLRKRFTGSVTIDRMAQGVQVTRVIRRGESVSGRDVKLMGTRLSLLPRGAMSELASLEGTVAREELRPGQWLTENSLETPDVIKRGQPVKIQLRRGSIQISAQGLSKQDGAIGEVIRVENLSSRREIHARVLSSDEVQVL